MRKAFVSFALGACHLRARSATVLRMWYFLLACEPAPIDESPVTDWEIEPAVIESPRVGAANFAVTEGEGIGAAFAQFLPVFAEGNPAWDVPTQILAVGMDELVADPGSCPFEVREGDVSTFKSDCRSRDGYEWAGSYDERNWDDGEIVRHAYTFDLTVTADVENADFTALELEGTVVLSRLDAVSHVDVDLSASLLGYFENRGDVGDPRIGAWADWQASGSVEFDDSVIRIEALADIGGSGGLPMGGTVDVDPGCVIEPTGELGLGGDVVARFEACDACADVLEGGKTASLACAP